MRTPRGPGFPLRMAVSLGSLLLLLASLCNASLSSSLSDDALVLEGTNVGDEGSSVNNWAVLVCTSRYWFNYRHMSNTLGMYRTVKRLGIPDSNIILMLADDVACNSRNFFPARVYANAGRHLDLYGEHIEVDYRGYEVNVENFIRLLTGRTTPDTPVAKRLNTNERSNIFIYMTGHGGDEFLKFQDQEEISAFDIADAFQQMHTQKRYNEIFFMIDTCQANTMYSKFYSPGILATGSSDKDENSYSHHSDPDLGVGVIDRYTHVILNYLETINKTSDLTLQDLFDQYSFEAFHSNAGIRRDLFRRSPAEVRLTEFFGGVAEVETVEEDDEISTYPVVEQGRQQQQPSSAVKQRKSGKKPDMLQVQRRTQQIRAGRSMKFEAGFILGLAHFLLLSMAVYWKYG